MRCAAAAGEANVNLHETALSPNRSLGFVKLRAYARQIALRRLKA